MGIFSNIVVDEDIIDDGDYVGGSSKLESGVYDFVIDMAYVDTATSGAISVNFVFKNAHTELKQQVYVTSGTQKGGNNYFIDKSGKKRYLPGFTIANSIALLAVGEELSALEPEQKVINVWNTELKKVAPTKKQVIMDLIGKEITLGVLRVIEPKRVKDASGNYVDSSETRTINEIDKVFRTSDHKTVTEIKAQEEAKFYETWIEKHKGVDKVKGAKPTTEQSPTTPATPKQSLFK